MDTCELRAEDGRRLVVIARLSLAYFLEEGQPYEPDVAPLPPALRAAGNSFVTLRRDGALRGCIGSTEPRFPLAHDVAYNAAASARDPRFFPVTPFELPDIRIEVSVLAPARQLAFGDEADLLARLCPGEEGVIVTWKGRRGLLLPQVWERIPDPRQFMEVLCRKANIPWRELQVVGSAVRVDTFRAHAFEEEGYFVRQ